MSIFYDSIFTPDSLLSRNPLGTARGRLLSRIVAPAMEPVTLAEAKLYLRVDTSTEDDLIADLITAARMMAEQWLRRSLITQTWKIAYDFALALKTFLPMGPVTAVQSVTVVNQDGSTAVANSASYWLDASKNQLVMNDTLTGLRVEITYTAGYGDSSDVPKPIKYGLLAHIASLYDARGDFDTAKMPEQTLGLYMPYREVRL